MSRIKIDHNIKNKNLSQDFLEHLGFSFVSEIKLSIFILVFLFYDIILLASLTAIIKIEYLWLLSPIIAILHLWTIRLFIKNVYSTQLETVLFLGVYGVIGTITFYILMHGISLHVLDISSLYYYISINIIIFIGSYFIIKYQIDKFSGDPTKERVKKAPSKLAIAFYSGAPGIGLIIAYSTADTVVLRHYITLGSNFIAVFMFVYFAAKFIHRYFFIKANMDYVVFQEPSKKEKIKLMKKGVEIK